MPWTRPELPRLRSQLGESAVLWARDVRIEEGRWTALSGAFSPRYNLVLCHGAGVVADAAQEIAAAGIPAIAMVAGAALEDRHELLDRDWVAVGEMPFMLRELHDPGSLGRVSAVRRLHGAELGRARALIAGVFGLHERLALVALPPDAAEKPGQAVWGAYASGGELVSCAAAVHVGELVAIWSLATAPACRRRGHAARLMHAVHADAGRRARASLLYAPVEAEPFYRALGYEVLERWQVFSRRRWGIGARAVTS